MCSLIVFLFLEIFSGHRAIEIRRHAREDYGSERQKQRKEDPNTNKHYVFMDPKHRIFDFFNYFCNICNGSCNEPLRIVPNQREPVSVTARGMNCYGL